MKTYGAIETIACDDVARRLTIGFDTGRIVRFDEVPRLVQVMLIADPEPDVAFDRHVRRQFASEEISESSG